MPPDRRDETVQPSSAATSYRPAAAALGATVGGIAALSCCVAPLVFVLVGISGAWIANLTTLSPYQPIFIAIAVASILYGHLATYRARRACGAETACAQPLPQGLVNAGLWAGTLLVAVALAANYFAPYLL